MKYVIQKTLEAGIETVFNMELERSQFLVKNLTEDAITVKLGNNTNGSVIGAGSFAASGSFFYYHAELEMTVEELNELFNSKASIKIIGQLDTPIETDLTPEEITAYKALHTNYPVTTILNDENAGMKVTYKQLESKTMVVN